MKHLYFIRHGESVMNTQGIFAGRLDSPLTDNGREQARHAASQMTDVSFDTIVSSNLSRARETAEIFARTIGFPLDRIIIDELFTEQTYGTLEGLPWTTPDWTTYPGIESDDALISRAKEALSYLYTLDADTVLLVSHGSFSRALLAAIHDTSMPPEEPENAKVVQFI